jgi:hypothetical protein
VGVRGIPKGLLLPAPPTTLSTNEPNTGDGGRERIAGDSMGDERDRKLDIRRDWGWWTSEDSGVCDGLWGVTGSSG